MKILNFNEKSINDYTFYEISFDEDDDDRGEHVMYVMVDKQKNGYMIEADLDGDWDSPWRDGDIEASTFRNFERSQGVNKIRKNDIPKDILKALLAEV